MILSHLVRRSSSCSSYTELLVPLAVAESLNFIVARCVYVMCVCTACGSMLHAAATLLSLPMPLAGQLAVAVAVAGRCCHVAGGKWQVKSPLGQPMLPQFEVVTQKVNMHSFILSLSLCVCNLSLYVCVCACVCEWFIPFVRARPSSHPRDPVLKSQTPKKQTAETRNYVLPTPCPPPLCTLWVRFPIKHLAFCHWNSKTFVAKCCGILFGFLLPLQS